MLRTALKGILDHKLRLALTAVSIVLGVAFVAGTFVLTDTIQRTYDSVFADAYEGVDAAVRTESAFDAGTAREPVPASLLATVEAVDEVADAEGVVWGDAQVVDGEGDVVGNGAAPTLGTGWVANDTLSPLRLREGREPVGATEVVVDVDTYEELDLAVGQPLRVVTVTGSNTYTVVGAVDFAGGELAGGTVVAWDLPTAQAVLDFGGTFGAIHVQADAGVSEADVRDLLTSRLPAGVEAITGSDLAEEESDGAAAAVAFFSVFLLTFGFIALFVGAFIIHNTFSIVVTQRTREMALLRALGATPRQVRRSVLVESVVVGGSASAVGLVLGVLVATGLTSLLASFGVEVPTGDLVVSGRTVVASLLMGTIVTVVSAVGPARRAAKVAPLAAMRAVDPSARAAGVRRTIAGLVLAGTGVTGVLAGLSGSGLALVGLGALGTFIGVSMVAPVAARPVAAVLGAPLSRLRGVPGGLARQNAMRSPRRTASTASALMIGLAIVAASLVLAASITRSVGGQVERQGVAPYILRNDQFEFSPALVAAVAAQPEVGAAYAVSFAPIRIDGATQDVTAIDPVALDARSRHQALALGTTQGDVATLADGGIAVQVDEAADHGWSLGDELAVEFPDGPAPQTLEVIYEENGATGNYMIAEAIALTHYSGLPAAYGLLVPADGVDDTAVRDAAERVIDAEYPGVEVLTLAEFADAQEAAINEILGLISALLALAIVIALLGVANTLALSIFERTKEIGLLRAIGTTRNQLRRTVRYEAAIVAAFGALLGLAIGVFFGISLVEAMSAEGIDQTVVPAAPLALLVVLTTVAGVGAAVLPARKAARMNVLVAISHE
jgi:putative ABC transport system permease protein